MSRLYCEHLVPVEEDCEKCIDIKMQEFHDNYWAAARAWQALRDWLNGVDDGEMKAWRVHIEFERDEGWQEGYDRAMHDVENA